MENLASFIWMFLGFVGTIICVLNPNFDRDEHGVVVMLYLCSVGILLGPVMLLVMVYALIRGDLS